MSEYVLLELYGVKFRIEYSKIFEIAINHFDKTIQYEPINDARFEDVV